MQRPGRLAIRQRCIKRLRLGERVGIDRQHGIQHRSRIVHCGDAVEEGLRHDGRRRLLVADVCGNLLHRARHDDQRLKSYRRGRGGRRLTRCCEKCARRS